MRFVPATLLAVSAIACLAGCSSSTPEKTGAKPAGAPLARITASNASNSLAKYIELVGFRITEKTPGKLLVHFGVVNHSQADVGDVKLKVDLTTTAAKPDEAPLVSFPAQVSGLGPSEMKEVTVDVPAKLRAYELPDWQFLIGRFEITEPK
jgi:type IV pilus biogenesis protein CpaD/CtpE